jgi:hypothetical protein
MGSVQPPRTLQCGSGDKGTHADAFILGGEHYFLLLLLSEIGGNRGASDNIAQFPS